MDISWTTDRPSLDIQSTCGLVEQNSMQQLSPLREYMASTVFHNQDKSRIVPSVCEVRLLVKLSSTLAETFPGPFQKRVEAIFLLLLTPDY